ncbi:MAG TPA: proline dehydrogenase family protein [Methylomirabilota bacterium]
MTAAVLRAVLLRLSARPDLGRALERSSWTRAFVRRFVAGTTPAEALDALATLNGRGYLGAVTYLGENVATPIAAARATDVYVHLLDEIARRRLRVVPSLKLTHLGLDLGEEVCVANVVRVLERAATMATRVWIDMESSVYTDRTLDVYARLRARFPHVACVVQAYLRRTPADVERLVGLGATVRLCKGAYREPSAIAFPRKADVDAAYARLAERFLSADAQARGVYVGFATHDERLHRHVAAAARTRGIGADRWEVQMLHGIRPDLHRTVAATATLRVLVPFGEDWWGYFLRRLAERPANLLFLVRNLKRRGGAYLTAPASGDYS